MPRLFGMIHYLVNGRALTQSLSGEKDMPVFMILKQDKKFSGIMGVVAQHCNQQFMCMAPQWWACLDILTEMLGEPCLLCLQSPHLWGRGRRRRDAAAFLAMRPCLKRDEVSTRTSPTECRRYTHGHGLASPRVTKGASETGGERKEVWHVVWG